MNTEVKDLWVKALRSGDYEQCDDVLTRVFEDGTKRHCCLGVLSELAVKAGVIPAGEDSTLYGNPILTYGKEDADQFLPKEVQEWAGLTEKTPYLKYGEVEGSADYWNDVKALTFPELADLIDAQL